ncbi:MAG: riboflavin synthase [Gemmatimonadota bacterium]
MFTGIVERTGVVRSVVDGDATRRVTIECGDLAPALALGDSVSVDGACFTVAALGTDVFEVDVIGTSLGRTVAGRYRTGTVVNLERALQMTGRLDGHLVQGHVDGTGHLESIREDGSFWRLAVRIPEDVARQTVERGSITINGVSLTVADMPEPTLCGIGLIPFTYEHTNLGRLEPGDPVNVEGDLIGKYVGKMLAARAQESDRS